MLPLVSDEVEGEERASGHADARGARQLSEQPLRRRGSLRSFMSAGSTDLPRCAGAVMTVAISNPRRYREWSRGAYARTRAVAGSFILRYMYQTCRRRDGPARRPVRCREAAVCLLRLPRIMSQRKVP